MNRKQTKQIHVGSVAIGGGAPISVQSMTNTLTKDVDATIAQMRELQNAGCDLIRSAINDLDDAMAIPIIKREIQMPFIADIQFDYKLALYAIQYGCDCLRINPGNIGSKERVREVIHAAKAKGVPIRIGVNSGSLRKDIIDRFGGVNAKSIVHSALIQIEELEDMGFFDIKVALKSSRVIDTIEACRLFSELSDYPLHLGITEAGPSYSGIIKSSVGIGTLLAEGIGDTLRVSLSADPVEEVRAGIEILKSLQLRNEGINLISCPTCARTKIDLLHIVEQAQKALSGYKANLTVAIMGCAVNGPGEAKEADFGIAGGDGEGLVFAKGRIIRKVAEENLLSALLEEINAYESEEIHGN